ncbi:uncharacterized protein LOC6595216 [Drosophila persimilis]|uniref:uncharacterized protein LOC6595216 n=1 Tax=Drosophila persimilis TaxID=7234 RepID=UPI00017FD44E|nr:uncharacterized protein LOC6595216 [Drosophila persimilis]
MCFRLNVLIQLVVMLLLILEITSKFEFTNIQCNSLDDDFSGIENCFLKSVNRSYKYLSLKVNLHKKPVSEIKVNVSLLKRFNGYKPFLYNITVDACKFLKNPKSKPIFNYFYSFFITQSNLNHSCPYDHDVIVDRLTADFVNHKITKVLSFPEGDYMVETNWMANGVNRALVKIYGTLS